MGTCGYRITKFRGRYWMFENHWDSYPEGLGQWLVDSIPADPKQYQKWLQSQRDCFGKWDSLLNEILTFQPEDMRKLLSDEPQSAVFFAAFDDRLQANAPPSYSSLGIDGYIEWTYTIDLDREVFSVGDGAHFTLNKIPDLWVEALFQDTESNIFLLPQLVPAESVASLVLDPPSFTFTAQYQSFQTRLVKPKIADQNSRSRLTGDRLRWMLFNTIQETWHRDLSIDLLGWQAQDLPFRELVFFILCLASGGDNLALLDQRRIEMPYSGALYLGITTEGSSEPGDTELATYSGVGYHIAGLPAGSAPEETKYWFEGALICLVPRLNYPGILGQAIVDAVEYGRAQCTTNSFNAVLISIEHLVLIKSFPDGTVDHTEVLPMILITSHLSQDPLARYGKRALEALYCANYSVKKQKVEEPDESDVGQLTQDSDQQNNKHGLDNDNRRSAKSEEHGCKGETEEETMRGHNDAVAAVEPEEGSDRDHIEEYGECPTTSGEECTDYIKDVAPIPVKDASTKSTFMALVQFFETITLETLRLTRANEARLPDEICEMVLRSVSDTKTYNACLKVSRRFRLICQQRPLVMDNIGLQDPLPKDQVSYSAQEKEDPNITPGAQIPPDFVAVEVSSDRQMNVWLRSGDSRSDALTFLVVAGHEWHRKTVVNGSLSFQGLCVPLAGAYEGGKRKMRTPAHRYDRKRETYDSEGTLWERPIISSNINIESGTREIGEFWNKALWSLEFAMHEPGAAWMFPPNTIFYFGTETTFDENNIRPTVECFHYLYLRVKRLGKFCDSQWEDIIREATEHLNQTQADDMEYFPHGGVIGGEEPFVILTVGLDVRLFQWEQGFDETVDEEARRKKSPSSALRELLPGKVLNICEKSDREDIERFLKVVKAHKYMTRARKRERCGGNN